MKKIYIVGNDFSYINLWLEDVEITSLEDSEIVLFTGGADVSPSLYSDNTGSRTMTNEARDKREVKAFIEALKMDKLIVGICRGSQFLTVANGGRLIQHVTGHLGVHTAESNDNTFSVSSTHHQMMFPFDLPKDEYELVAWSLPKRSITYLNGDDEETVLPAGFKEPEIVWYPKTKSLAIQCHPEYDWCPTDGRQFCRNLLIEKYNKHYQPQFFEE